MRPMRSMWDLWDLYIDIYYWNLLQKWDLSIEIYYKSETYVFINVNHIFLSNWFIHEVEKWENILKNPQNNFVINLYTFMNIWNLFSLISWFKKWENIFEMIMKFLNILKIILWLTFTPSWTFGICFLKFPDSRNEKTYS